METRNVVPKGAWIERKGKGKACAPYLDGHHLPKSYPMNNRQPFEFVIY